MSLSWRIVVTTVALSAMVAAIGAVVLPQPIYAVYAAGVVAACCIGALISSATLIDAIKAAEEASLDAIDEHASLGDDRTVSQILRTMEARQARIEALLEREFALDVAEEQAILSIPRFGGSQ